MSIMPMSERFATDDVIELVIRERAVALSEREWKHRIAGYGYYVRKTDAGMVLETLPHHIEICQLPDHFTA